MTIAPPRIECLEKAREAVLERADAYGRPEDLFTAIATRWTLTLRHKLKDSISARDVAILMDDMKTERIIAGGTGDCWVDKAGYAACGFEVDARAAALPPALPPAPPRQPSATADRSIIDNEATR